MNKYYQWGSLRYALASLALVSWLLSSCASPPDIPLAERPTREEMFDRLDDSRAEFTSLQGIGKYRFSQREKSFSATQVVFAQQPDRLRVETLGLFNSTALMLATDGSFWTVLLPGEGKAYQGEVSSGVLQRFMQLPLRVEDVVAMLLRQPLLPAWDEDTIRYESNGDSVLVLNNAYGMQQEVVFDLQLNIVRFDYYLAGGLQMRISFGDFAEQTRFPRHLNLQLPLDKLEMDFQFSDVDVNVEHPEGRFTLSPPDGYDIVPLRGGG